MSKSLMIFLVFIGILLGLTAVTVAQDDDPNLCTDGTWYCSDPNDPWREAWNWVCGWWWGHYYAGLVATVPEGCIPFEPVAPEPGPEPEPGFPACTTVAPGCYNALTGPSTSILVYADMTTVLFDTADCLGIPSDTGVLTSGSDTDCFGAGYSSWSNGFYYYGISCDLCSGSDAS